MGHTNEQMAFETYGAWMNEMNPDQILPENAKLAR